MGDFFFGQLVSRSATVSAVRFFPDGLKVAATSNTKKLFVLDVETGKEVVQYDNCKLPLSPFVQFLKGDV